MKNNLCLVEQKQFFLTNRFLVRCLVDTNKSISQQILIYIAVTFGNQSKKKKVITGNEGDGQLISNYQLLGWYQLSTMLL